MELKPALKKLKESREFKDWAKKNKDTFFSYAFKMIENGKSSQWQLGFYRRATDRITTFIVDESLIEIKDDDEIFKKPDTEVKQIDMEKAKLPFKEALEKAGEFQKKEYPKELVSKTIAILQNLEEHGTVWNITYLTQSLKTLNMKINPENGKVITHNLDSLMSFVKK